jgi:formylglycine-generating enzyme required for sulfatase activity
MSAIFISHSSKDRAVAAEVRRRLEEQKHASVFLDFDPELGIPAGSAWERELYTQLRRCRALIVLCSEHSMSSKWCFAEIAYARAQRKPLFPVKVADCTVASLLADTQVIDLTADREEGYARLWAGLRKAGLDPAGIFNWDEGRAPFPGLKAFDEKDAAVFFGREHEVQNLLADLNHARGVPDPRLFVVRGASGSGKSSLIRGGVLPRLGRDPEEWAVLEAFRPADTGGPFTGFALVLARALERAGRPRDWRDLRDLLRTLAAGGGIEPLVELAVDLAPRQQGVVVTIDQAEELLGPERVEAMELFVRLLGRIANIPNGPFFVILTLRSDFLPAFEDHPDLQGKREGIHVPPLAVDALARIIEGPAEVAGIELESGLVQRMVSESGATTALPILAFVLRQLWERHGQATNRLTLQDYDTLEGLEGAIGRAADKAYGEAVHSEEQAAALRRAFLSMVQVSEEGQVMRRPATFAGLPRDLDEMLERFVRARLLVKSSEDGGLVVEVAHEAVLTGWPRLAGWIQETHGDLRLLRQVKLAAAEWERKANAEEFLWPDKRLVEVYDMIDRLAPDLSAAERRFVGLVDGDGLWAELQDPGTRHHRRAQIGDRLAKAGDVRPGVGLRADGLPDLAWCDVPSGLVELDGHAFPVEPFQIAKYPVTWAQYSVFLEAADGFSDPRWHEGLAEHEEHPCGTRSELPNRPAANLSWYDAVAFCRWLSARLGFEIRLPTEWEWQQAATGGEPANRYPWGPEWDSQRANTLDNGLQRTTAVGMYPHGASPVGALDLSGNVYEWCLNQHERPEQIGLEGSDKKAVRGGSWQWSHDWAGATVRGMDAADFRVPDHGFRVVRTTG